MAIFPPSTAWVPHSLGPPQPGLPTGGPWAKLWGLGSPQQGDFPDFTHVLYSFYIIYIVLVGFGIVLICPGGLTRDRYHGSTSSLYEVLVLKFGSVQECSSGVQFKTEPDLIFISTRRPRLRSWPVAPWWCVELLKWWCPEVLKWWCVEVLKFGSVLKFWKGFS